jgi:ribulose-5-phosphate 4-epimerase/fuculose-1-phosphate aldolase
MVDELSGLRREVALACRLLARQGLIDGILGHVSVRVGTDRLLVRCRGPRERGLLFTVPEDIRLLDFEGAGRLGDYAPPNELPLHVETLRNRPDVTAVVHAHPPAVVAAELAGVTLRPIVGAFNIPATRMAAAGIPVYPRAVLINRRELAEEMLAELRDSPVCLLRGHGLTAVGDTLQQSVIRAINVDELARLSLAVARCGREPAPVPDDDLAELPDLGSGFNDGFLWEYHLQRLRHEGLGL